MLNDVIGDLLPSAFAVVLSPIPIVAIVLVLGAPHARSAGPAFALGWIGGLLAVSVIVVLVLGAGSDPDSDDPGVSWLKISLGILFLVIGLRPMEEAHEGRPESRDAEVDDDHRRRNTREDGGAGGGPLRGESEEPGAHTCGLRIGPRSR